MSKGKGVSAAMPLKVEFLNAEKAFGLSQDGSLVNPNGRAEFESFASDVFQAAGAPGVAVQCGDAYWDIKTPGGDKTIPHADLGPADREGMEDFLVEAQNSAEYPLYSIIYKSGTGEIQVAFIVPEVDEYTAEPV